jgi:hypothetical protein
MQILLYVIADFPVLKAALAASTLRPLTLKAVEAGLPTGLLGRAAAARGRSR